MKAKVVEWVGDGTTGRWITGVGFQPDLVIVRPNDNTHTSARWRIDAITYLLGGTGTLTAGVTGFGADGFEVGVHCNGSGVTYRALCIEASGGDAAVGTYTGDGLAEQTVTGAGFRGAFLLVRGRSTATGQVAWWRTSESPSGYAASMFLGETLNTLKSFTDDGFVVGNANGMNVAGRVYNYLVLSQSLITDGWMNVGSVTGDGTDDRNLDVVGFQPDWLWHKSTAGISGAVRTKYHSGDLCSHLVNVADAANLIQAFRSQGYQVGNDDKVNKSAQAYRWWAIREGDSQAASEKEASDSASATEVSDVDDLGDIVFVTASDSGTTGVERAGYWRYERVLGIPEHHIGGWAWRFHSGVEAFLAAQQSGATDDAWSQVVHELVFSSDTGALADALTEPPPVEHLRQEPITAAEVAALWYEIAVTDSNAGGDDQAVLEINPVGDSDTGAAVDTAGVPVGYYEGADAGLATEQARSPAAFVSATEAGIASESAQKIAILSRHILECSIESTLDALADALDISLVETDPADPLTPKTQAWRSLGEGDLVQVRLGLAGVDQDDYGAYRIDQATVRASESQIITELHGRDRAALLIEERGRSLGRFRIAPYPEQDATQATRPRCAAVARRIAAQAGLGLVWDAPDYELEEFAIRPEEPLSAALRRLLEPLQASQRYRTDAWVDGDNLVVRRRGNGPTLGEVDCGQGLVRSIARERQPEVGEVTVTGGAEVVLTEWAPEEGKTAAETETVQTTVDDDGQGNRVTRTYLLLEDGRWVQSEEEQEKQTFAEVTDPETGRWAGRVVSESVSIVSRNMHLPARSTERRVTRYGYDSSWRLVQREERRCELRGAEWTPLDRTVVRYEQLTPTDVRATTTQWQYASGQWQTKAGYPQRVDQPGTLQSALRAAAGPDQAWRQNEDGTEPTKAKGAQTTRQYQGQATGVEGGVPAQLSFPNLMSDSACQQIADDLASESGAWRYQIELFWPRPWPYRKGDRVTLTNLPGDLPDLDAIITRVRTQFSVAEAAWTHDITLEAWADE